MFWSFKAFVVKKLKRLKLIQQTQEIHTEQLDNIRELLTNYVPRNLRIAIAKLNGAADTLDTAITKFYWCNSSQEPFSTHNMGSGKGSLTMANADLSDEIASVEKAKTVIESATALINGFQARLDAAIAAALEGGATAAQLQPLSDLSVQLGESSDALADAVVANTPAE